MWTAAALALLSTLPAKAATLLTVDLSVADQITISATGGLSSGTVTGAPNTGFCLAGNFATPNSVLVLDSAPLNTAALRPASNTTDGIPSIFASAVNPGTGLNIYAYSADASTTFTAGTLAFLGSSTFPVDSTPFGNLAAGPATGLIYAFAENDGDIPAATEIGSWQRLSVVPLPAPMLLLGGALMGLCALRARRKSV